MDDIQFSEFLDESIPLWRNDPVMFFREVLSFEPDEWQAEAARDLAANPKVSIKSGQGVGKTGLEAAVFLWFITCFPYPRIVATAPTKQQLHDVLWSEISKWMSKSELLSMLLKWTKTYVYMVGNEKRWFGVARTATKPENMQGFHEDNMLFIVDEASGVADPIMEAILGTLSGANNKLLLCGNPTRTSGTFYDSHTRDRALYKCHTVSSADSSRTNKENIDSLIRKYGWDSNVVRVRVRGEFPNQEDDVFIPLSLIEQCSSKLLELDDSAGMQFVSLGVDVARFGDDETIIYRNYHGHCKIVRNRRGQNLMATVGDIVQEFKKIYREHPTYESKVYVQIDDTGLGGGVTDRLKEVRKEQKLYKMQVIPINAAEKIETDTAAGKDAAERYNNLTTAMWASMRDLLDNKQIVIEDDEQTIGQLSSRKYTMASNGKLEIEPKKEMKKRGLDSPDRADALALALYLGNIQKLTESAQIALKSAETSLQEGSYGMLGNTFDSLFQSLDNGHGFLGIGADADQSALNELYQSMKPDVSSMQSLIDQYRESGQAIPKSLMDGFNEAIEVGAAAGDEDAAWQNYANQIMESGSEEMKSVLTDPNNPMYESVRATLPEQFREAIDRATAETTDDEITLEGLKASVDGDVDIDKDAWVSAMNEKLGDLATTEEVTAEGAKIKIEAGDCLWDIGNALGVDWHKIAEENGIEEPYIIHPRDEITISMDTLKAEVNGDAAQAAISDAMSALTTEGAEFSVTAEGVKVDLSNVEVDSESATAQIEAALGMESGTLAANDITVTSGATVTIPQELVNVDTSGIQSATESQTETEPVEADTTANVNITDATTDASGAKEQAQSEVESTFSESMPTDGHTDVTLDQTNNAAEVYSEVAGEVQSTFSNPIPASCTVNVTLDWHITNPSAGITTSGSGSSVKASIAGNAEGSIVTGPLLSWVGEDGPEAIIPLGSKRRDRGMDLWLQAGRALGVKEYADGGMIGDVPLSGGSSDSSSGSSGNNGDKGQIVVNMNPVFNINGEGGNDTVNSIKEKLKELINEMSGELASRLLESYANMPT